MPSKKLKCSFGAIMQLGMSAAVAVIAVIGTTVVTDRVTQDNAALRRRIEDLRGANTRLAEFDTAALAQVRAQADLFRQTLLNDDSIDRFKTTFANDWSLTELGEEANSEYRKIRYELSRSTVPMAEWHKVSSSVVALQGKPGMLVRRVEIQTAGDEKQRSFDRIVLGVTLFARTRKI